MYRWVVNDNPARNTRIMITICTPTMHDTIIRKMVRGSNIPWKCTFLFPLEVTFLPSSSSPFSSLSLSYSVRHDGSRFRSYTKIRTRSILRSKLIEFFRDSISRIIRRQVFNELLCTSRFRNLSINHHPRKRGLYTAHEIKVWTGRIDGINLRQSTPPPPSPNPLQSEISSWLRQERSLMGRDAEFRGRKSCTFGTERSI